MAAVDHPRPEVEIGSYVANLLINDALKSANGLLEYEAIARLGRSAGLAADPAYAAHKAVLEAEHHALIEHAARLRTLGCALPAPTAEAGSCREHEQAELAQHSSVEAATPVASPQSGQGKEPPSGVGGHRPPEQDITLEPSSKRRRTSQSTNDTAPAAAVGAPVGASRLKQASGTLQPATRPKPTGTPQAGTRPPAPHQIPTMPMSTAMVQSAQTKPPPAPLQRQQQQHLVQKDQQQKLPAQQPGKGPVNQHQQVQQGQPAATQKQPSQQAQIQQPKQQGVTTSAKQQQGQQQQAQRLQVQPQERQPKERQQQQQQEPASTAAPQQQAPEGDPSPPTAKRRPIVWVPQPPPTDPAIRPLKATLGTEEEEGQAAAAAAVDATMGRNEFAGLPGALPGPVALGANPLLPGIMPASLPHPGMMLPLPMMGLGMPAVPPALVTPTPLTMNPSLAEQQLIEMQLLQLPQLWRRQVHMMVTGGGVPLPMALHIVRTRFTAVVQQTMQLGQQGLQQLPLDQQQLLQHGQMPMPGLTQVPSQQLVRPPPAPTPVLSRSVSGPGVPAAGPLMPAPASLSSGPTQGSGQPHTGAAGPGGVLEPEPEPEDYYPAVYEYPTMEDIASQCPGPLLERYLMDMSDESLIQQLAWSCKRWFVLLSLGPLEVPTLVDSLTPSHLTWMARQGTLGPQTLCCGVPEGSLDPGSRCHVGDCGELFRPLVLLLAKVACGIPDTAPEWVKDVRGHHSVSPPGWGIPPILLAPARVPRPRDPAPSSASARVARLISSVPWWSVVERYDEQGTWKLYGGAAMPSQHLLDQLSDGTISSLAPALGHKEHPMRTWSPTALFLPIVALAEGVHAVREESGLEYVGVSNAQIAKVNADNRLCVARG